MAVGVLLVSYGSREACMAEALTKGRKDVKLLVADRQRNPLNIRLASEHVVISDLNVQQIARFAEKNASEIDFVLVGPEAPIVNGIRDVIEDRLGIPVLCPTKAAAVECSKSKQRKLIEHVVPEANPPYRVFLREGDVDVGSLKRELWSLLDEFGEVVVKPDGLASGKGVGVWGDHFSDRAGFFEYFMSLYSQGPVVVEKKIECEEFSLQFLSDSKKLIPTPAVRDYKRAFDGDTGPNTGGMGSYKDVGDVLPFMSEGDFERGVEIANKLFKAILSEAGDDSMRGFPMYMAYAISSDGLKVFEVNSRAGDPEVMCILPILEDDFVEVCFKMLDGSFGPLRFEEKATVATYLVPPTYGGRYPGPYSEVEVDLLWCEEAAARSGGSMRVYPGSMDLRGKRAFSLRSRTVCVVGIGNDVEEARQISLSGIRAVKGEGLWYRTDVASREHIAKSVRHAKALRGEA